MPFCNNLYAISTILIALIFIITRVNKNECLKTGSSSNGIQNVS